MACDDAAAVSQALTAAASDGIRSQTTDGITTELYKLTELIEAEKYVRSKCAARNRRLGLRFVKLKYPGTL